MQILQSAMRRSRQQKPPSLYLASSSTRLEISSYYPSSVLSDDDADDEGLMSSAEFLSSTPLSVAIPAGPYCPRRPTLQEVLANVAPPPWTLSAFMAYLSQNHCLETLEFTMDASRYRRHYDALTESDLSSSNSGGGGGSSSEDRKYVTMLWRRLLHAYIVPNGPREVNLPSDVRDAILSLPHARGPPHPAALEPAVKIIYELMDESVLVPFLNAVAPSRGSEGGGGAHPQWSSPDDMPDMVFYGGSPDERVAATATARGRRDQSPPSSGFGVDVVQSSCAGGPAPRPSHHSHLSAALSRSSSRLSAYLLPSTPPSSDAPDVVTDDGASSPSHSGSEPMTPPTTPPTSGSGFFGISPGSSPKNARRGGGEGGGWKKMGAKLGWKKSLSSSGHGASASTSGGGGGKYPLKRGTPAEDESMS